MQFECKNLPSMLSYNGSDLPRGSENFAKRNSKYMLLLAIHLGLYRTAQKNAKNKK